MKRHHRFVAVIALALSMGALMRSMRQIIVDRDAAIFTTGLLAGMTLAGVAYGIVAARRIEDRRKKKLHIWLKH